MHNPESSPIDFSQITIYELPKSRSFSMRSLLVGAGAVGLSATLAYGVMTAPENTPSSVASEATHDFHDEGTLEYTAPNPPQTCPTPTESDISVVEDLFKAPQINYQDTKDFNDTYYRVLPKQFGLTLHRPDALFNLNTYDPKVTFSNVLQETQQFLSQYSITISVMTPKEAKNHTALASSIPTKKELEDPDTKVAVASIASEISIIPEEYVRQVGLKHILLVTKGDGFAAYAETSDPHDTVVVSVDKAGGLGLMGHEFMHLVDTTQCGSADAAENDRAFESVNGNVPYDSELEAIIGKRALLPRPLSYEDVSFEQPTMDLGDGASLSCEDASTIERAMKVYSQYSYTSVVEDKAEIGKNLFSRWGYQTIMSEYMPALRQKALILLARMYKQNPNVVRYYAAITERPPATDPICDPMFINK